jgi:hypothetical protein
MEKDVAAAAAKLINGSTLHSNRQAYGACPALFLFTQCWRRDEGFFAGDDAAAQVSSFLLPRCAWSPHSCNPLHQRTSRSQSLGSAVSAFGSVLQSTAQVRIRIATCSAAILLSCCWQAVRRGSVQFIENLDHHIMHLGDRAPISPASASPGSPAPTDISPPSARTLPPHSPRENYE